MDIKRVLGNIGAATVAQLASLIVSLATSLLVPKVLGVEGFGYWQLFIFYFGYAGAFQLGLNDGVYLIKGGESRDSLDRSGISSQLAFGFSFQSILATFILVAIILMQPPFERAYVLTSCALLMPLYNTACFFQYLFQAIDETRTYSKSIILERLLLLVALSILMGTNVRDFKLYVLAFAVCKLIWLVYFLIKARGIITTKLLPIRETILLSASSMRVGIKLMLANLASTLILGIMRFFVDGNWGIEVFSQVSLALSMANFFLTFVSQVAMVLFPSLRKMSAGQLRRFFGSAQNVLETLLPAILLLYLPVKYALSLWLPDYAASFNYLGLLLPLCLFDGKMNALYSTVFKVKRLESLLLALNASTVLFSATLAAIGVMLFNSLEFVLIGGAASVTLRATASCSILSKAVLGKSRIRYGEILLSSVFVFGVMVLPDLPAVGLYLIAYLVYLFANIKSSKKMLDDFRELRKRVEDYESDEA